MSVSSFNFDGIGTDWQIDFYDHDAQDLEKIKVDIGELVNNFDQTYSRFRTDSLVAKIAQKTGTYDFPTNSTKLFEIYEKLYQASEGKFTSLIGKLLAETGYDSTYSLKPSKTLVDTPLWNDAISIKNNQITTKIPVVLDFGAVGKGFLADLIAEYLLSQKINSFCIDASGDILHKNTQKSLKIGLENPRDSQQAIGVAEIANHSLCASSSNRRKWKNFHHIIDPISKTSPENIIATWVTANNTAWADGLATALFLTPAHNLQSTYDFEYVILYHDMSFEKSPNFPGELFIN